jgi:G:T-mismatch repair DNA endonuclease (very short patch repair protein)
VFPQKVSIHLFEAITVDGSRWGIRTETNLGEKMITGPNNKRYMIDFVCGNKAIEFNGDFWHANPAKFKPTDLIRKHKTQIFTAQEIWHKDAIKTTAIIDAGYELLVVWENDYRKDPIGTVQRCKDFLNGAENNTKTI